MSIDTTVKDLLAYDFRKLNRRTQQVLRTYGICAEDFLGFAKKDSEGQGLRSRINALGNAKRAIECRVDTILYNFCLQKKREKEHWNFPDKIEVLRKLGIVAPDILRKITNKRNLLEHQYIKPTRENINDAIGVAELFLNATDERAIVHYEAKNDFKIELRHQEGIVKLTDYKNNVEKTATIDTDDGWIEFAGRLSALLRSSPISFYRHTRKNSRT